MRKPKALVIPYKFREGYPDEIVDPFISDALELLDDTGIDYEKTETVIRDSDADLVAGKYNPNSYDFTILLMPTWFEPGTMVRAARNFFGMPVIVWGYSNFLYNGERTNLGSTAGAGAAKGTLREYGVKHEYIYYSPKNGQDEKIKGKLWKTANAARAISLLKSARILSIGYLFGGMTIGDMDLTKMRSFFGPDLMEVDNYTLISKMEAVDINGAVYREAAEKIMLLTGNTIGNKLEKVTRMYVAIKALTDEYNAQAVTLRCHFALSQEYGLTACIPLSVLGNEMVASCEADIPLTLTQLILHYLSGGELTTYADTHELTGTKILWGACGFAPAGMCIGGKIVCQLPAENPTGLGATFKDYITNKNCMKEGRMTVARILKEPDGSFTLHAAGGRAVGEIGAASEFGSPQYSFTEMILDADFDRFAGNMGSHHYALVYAELLEDLELFCKYTDITAMVERI